MVKVQEAEQLTRRRAHRGEVVSANVALEFVHLESLFHAHFPAIIGVNVHQDLVKVDRNCAVVEITRRIPDAEVDFEGRKHVVGDFILIHVRPQEIELPEL